MGELSELVDSHGLADVLRALGEVLSERADLLSDEDLGLGSPEELIEARLWRGVARQLGRVVRSLRCDGDP